jgi:hypothetical protein
MSDVGHRAELERRLEQSRRLLKAANDVTTQERISLLIHELEKEQKRQRGI